MPAKVAYTGVCNHIGLLPPSLLSLPSNLIHWILIVFVQINLASSLNSHYAQIFTSAYDYSIRRFSFASCISQEVYSTGHVLITSMDVVPTGHEIWFADANGGLTHLDLRQSRGKERWYEVSDHKVGSVSINPTNPHFLVTASNSRLLR